MNPQPKILIIDDDPDAVHILGDELKAVGYQVVTAYTGLEGLKVAQREMPDLVLLDLLLPDLNGYEVCKRMRQDRTLMHIPIIVVTGVMGQQMVSLLYGANDIMTKPVYPEELIAKIQAYLSNVSSA